MRSIRVKVTAITITAILLSILSVFVASFLIIQNETDRNSVEMMKLIDSDTQKILEKYFENIEQSVEIAANIAIDTLDPVFLVECGAISAGEEKAVQTKEQIEELNAYLKAYCSKIQDFFSGVADYTQGVTAYFYCINPEISQSELGFFYMKVGNTGFVEQPPLDVQHLIPTDSLHGTWYEAAVHRGRPAWVGPYNSLADQGNWVCSYFVPVYKAGMLIGVMGMDIPCSTLVAQIEDIRVYETGYVCLVAADGQVIYHPDLPIGGSLDELGISVQAEILQRGSSGEEMIRYQAEGGERQLAFSTFKNGMKLISIAPTNEIKAPWTRLIRAILIISVIIVTLFAVMLLFIMRVVTEPLKQLTAASQKLADANYDVDLNYQGQDEIGTLTGAFTVMRDQIRCYIEDLNHQLYFDKLTGLPNMRHFFRLAREAREKMLKEGQKPVIVHFNIVNLGNINRQLGFDMGDRVILTFAGILQEAFPPDRICRFGGDHFAAVSTEDSIDRETDEILRKYETVVDGQSLHLRIGIYPNALERVDVNIAYDRAKYAADQKMGEFGSSVTWYDETMLRKAEMILHVIHNLDQALQEGWVQVYYQPIVRTANGKVCDEEALARWIDPVLGFLSPAEFIPALEESKLIYKLDLYVVDQVLEKMKKQVESGFYLVPQSINLSRMDFESCDVVEEIRRRVDDAGFERSMITIEITESVIGGNFDFMKGQVERFRQLGFPVWMDDFGSGYSSLDVLQQIHFDLIKFDMRFMERFEEGDESRIILTELMNMAIALGTETVCEGVEKAEQVEFLKEIGCTRIQGYYYGKPLPFHQILKMLGKEITLEFENPEESGYYASIGRINLYDLTAIAKEDDKSLEQYFNTLPMCIMEVNGTRARYNRCNRSFREFMHRTMAMHYDTEEIDCGNLSGRPAAAFLKTVVRCGRDGGRMILDEKGNENTLAHILIRRVAVNPVTGTAAVAVAVLAVVRAGDDVGASYGEMARALAVDYVNLFDVHVDTEQYVEYSPDSDMEDLIMERHGKDFFSTAQKEARLRLYKEDQETFIKAFTKENVLRSLNQEGRFSLNYRLMQGDKPRYVDMKAVRLMGDPYHIIFGVSDVDAQMREKETLSRIQAEKTIYSRVIALTQGFICIYTINPETGYYMEYRASSEYAGLGVPTEGDDFFGTSQKQGERLIYPEDLPKFQALIQKENILEHLRKESLYSFNYRLLLNGQPRYMSLKAVMVKEESEQVLIIGVNDIDAQVRHEQDYERKLAHARSKASLDTLTGVRDRTAYKSMAEMLKKQKTVQYAIVLCRARGLEWVNEDKGWEAGNQLIRDACGIICEVFRHSPVFRVAGNLFAVIAEGTDYEQLDDRARKLEETNDENMKSGKVCIDFGMARYDGGESVASVFERAEKACMKEAEQEQEQK